MILGKVPDENAITYLWPAMRRVLMKPKETQTYLRNVPPESKLTSHLQNPSAQRRYKPSTNQLCQIQASRTTPLPFPQPSSHPPPPFPAVVSLPVAEPDNFAKLSGERSASIISRSESRRNEKDESDDSGYSSASWPDKIMHSEPTAADRGNWWNRSEKGRESEYGTGKGKEVAGLKVSWAGRMLPLVSV
jgi:hypothetical protein